MTKFEKKNFSSPNCLKLRENRLKIIIDTFCVKNRHTLNACISVNKGRDTFLTWPLFLELKVVYTRQKLGVTHLHI